ncbi:MAG: sulfite exporter TauE/SafE family protein [Burkholderiales bacterium]
MNNWLQAMLLAAFLTGVLGGAHCAAMCGGIVGAVCRPRSGAGAQWCQALAYNGGRIFSYTVAGALAGALGYGGLALRGGPLAQQILLAMAGTTLLLMALAVAGVTSVARALEAAGGVIWRRLQPYSRWFLPVDSMPRALGLGALWGWLPCGMVYAVLLTAVATADVRHGALVMLAFGLGTLPNMLAIALLSAQLRKFSALRPVRLAAGAVIGGLGVFGIVKALQPAAWGSDGLLCHAVPALSSLLQ